MPTPGRARGPDVPSRDRCADADIFAPPLRAVLWKSIGLALALIIAVSIALDRAIVWLVGAKQQLGANRARAACQSAGRGARLWVLSIAAGFGIVVGGVMLMPAVTSFVASFFADQIADIVEHEHYPADPPGKALPLWLAVIEGSKTALLAIVVYLCAVVLLLFVGLGAVIYCFLRHRMAPRPHLFRTCRHALSLAE